MQIIDHLFAALWSFALQLAQLVLLLWIILQALRSLFGSRRR
jgi:hypothetical protein